jgi:hypothetical protein
MRACRSWNERQQRRNQGTEANGQIMKFINKRICLLEKRVANHEIGGPSAVEILRERRRRRAEASGQQYVEHQPDPALYANSRRPTCAEILRSARARRCVRAEAERANSDARNDAANSG